MVFKDVLKKRHSVRKFQETEISDKIIKEILELANLAPSAGNLRSYKVITTREKVLSIEAPVYLIICSAPEISAARYGDRGRNLYSIQDATIFAAYIQLIIVDMGLSSVWVGAFNENRIKRVLKIDKELRPIAIIPIGYEK